MRAKRPESRSSACEDLPRAPLSARSTLPQRRPRLAPGLTLGGGRAPFPLGLGGRRVPVLSAPAFIPAGAPIRRRGDRGGLGVAAESEVKMKGPLWWPWGPTLLHRRDTGSLPGQGAESRVPPAMGGSALFARTVLEAIGGGCGSERMQSLFLELGQLHGKGAFQFFLCASFRSRRLSQRLGLPLPRARSARFRPGGRPDCRSEDALPWRARRSQEPLPGSGWRTRTCSRSARPGHFQLRSQDPNRSCD